MQRIKRRKKNPKAFTHTHTHKTFKNLGYIFIRIRNICIEPKVNIVFKFEINLKSQIRPTKEFAQISINGHCSESSSLCNEA